MLVKQGGTRQTKGATNGGMNLVPNVQHAISHLELAVRTHLRVRQTRKIQPIAGDKQIMQVHRHDS